MDTRTEEGRVGLFSESGVLSKRTAPLGLVGRSFLPNAFPAPFSCFTWTFERMFSTKISSSAGPRMMIGTWTWITDPIKVGQLLRIHRNRLLCRVIVVESTCLEFTSLTRTVPNGQRIPAVPLSASCVSC